MQFSSLINHRYKQLTNEFHLTKEIHAAIDILIYDFIIDSIMHDISTLLRKVPTLRSRAQSNKIRESGLHFTFN